MNRFIAIATLVVALVIPTTALAGGDTDTPAPAEEVETVITAKAPSASADDNCDDDPTPAPAEAGKTATMTCDEVEAQIAVFERLREQCQQATDEGKACDEEEVEQILTFSEEVRDGMRAEWRRAVGAERTKRTAEIARLDEAVAGINAELTLQKGLIEQNTKAISVLDQNLKDFIAKSTENWKKQAERDKAQDERITAADTKAATALTIIRGKVVQIEENTDRSKDNAERVTGLEQALAERELRLTLDARFGGDSVLAPANAPAFTQLVKGETLKRGWMSVDICAGLQYRYRRLVSGLYGCYDRSLTSNVSGFQVGADIGMSIGQRFENEITLGVNWRWMRYGLENSIVYQANQSGVGARLGYCRKGLIRKGAADIGICAGVEANGVTMATTAARSKSMAQLGGDVGFRVYFDALPKVSN